MKNLKIDNELHKKLKVASAKSGKTIYKLTTEMLEKGLATLAKK